MNAKRVTPVAARSYRGKRRRSEAVHNSDLRVVAPRTPDMTTDPDNTDDTETDEDTLPAAPGDSDTPVGDTDQHSDADS